MVEGRGSRSLWPAGANRHRLEVGVFAQGRQVQRCAETGANHANANGLLGAGLEHGFGQWFGVAHNTSSSWRDRGTARHWAGLGALRGGDATTQGRVKWATKALPRDRWREGAWCGFTRAGAMTVRRICSALAWRRMTRALMR